MCADLCCHVHLTFLLFLLVFSSSHDVIHSVKIQAEENNMVAATHIHTHVHLFTFSKRGLSLPIYPAGNQASSARDDTKITRHIWYMSNG